jgi:hypothetical protein
MKLGKTFTTLALMGSLIALASQCYAQIDFDTGGSSNVVVSSTSGSQPTQLRTVTAICRVNGFLFATVASAFSVTTTGTSPKFAEVDYSIAKDSTAMDTPTFNSLRFPVPLQPSGTAGVASAAGSTMRVDNCTAGQSVTYRFVAVRVGLTASDTVTSIRPKLVVTFFETKL